MSNIFFPSELISSTYRIDFERLYREGYRGILFDIDNTLVPHGAPADERAIRLFERLKKIGYRCCLVSNNKQPRVEMFNKDVNVDIVWLAHKPLPGGYRKGMQKMGTGYLQHAAGGRPDLHGPVGRKLHRHVYDPGEAHQSEGGDPDRPEEDPGAPDPLAVPALEVLFQRT